MSEPLMAFYGDDFTGSTDAMESLALAGLATVLFTQTPTREQLARLPSLKAFGVAGRSRAMSPAQMREELSTVLCAIRDTGVPIIHYKVCSTFDSSPGVGSIGCAINIGAEVFGTKCIPIVGGAPHLGRHCVFGNLFAKGSGDVSPVRLDRHPNMVNHPVTPMNESDLRKHLAGQTDKPIALLDVMRLSDPTQYMQLIGTHRGAVLIDFLTEPQALQIGMHLVQHANRERPLFVVGSSGVEAALSAVWTRGESETRFAPVVANGPLLVTVGSCSPVTARQITWAEANGFAVFLVTGDETVDIAVVRDAITQLEMGRSVVVHTGGATSNTRSTSRERIGDSLTIATRSILEQHRLARLLVAGGDTSGMIAVALRIVSMEMVGTLVRGAPLCRATSTLPFVDGIEVVFKGGQIGRDDFFGVVQHGSSVSEKGTNS